MTQNSALSAKQIQAISALLTSPSVTAAAEAAEVSRRTLQRWLTDSDFQAALQGAERQALADLTRIMAGSATQAQAALLEILNDSEAPAMARIRAASEFLTHLPKLREVLTVEERLLRLEESINAKP